MKAPASFVCAAAMIGIMAASAMADDGYKIPDVKDPGNWQSVLIALVALGAICLVAFKNANRSHLD